MEFSIGFSGHRNIRSNHQRTIEITKEGHLTPQGDCIIGVNAACACADLPEEIKQEIRDPESRITLSIRVGDENFVVTGRGDPGLILTHQHDIVVRKSDFVCPRTLAVGCDKASDMIPRSMVSALQDPMTRGTLTITVGGKRR